MSSARETGGEGTDREKGQLALRANTCSDKLLTRVAVFVLPLLFSFPPEQVPSPRFELELCGVK